MKKITCLTIITIVLIITFASLSSDEPAEDSKNQGYTSLKSDRNTMQTDQNENNRDNSFRLGEKEQLSSPTTVTYSIPEWGLYNRSYSYDSNTAINAQTGKRYCYFKITNENGEIYKITPDSIEKLMQRINGTSKKNSKHHATNRLIKTVSGNAASKQASLEKLKELLEDPEEMIKRIDKLKKAMPQGGLESEYTFDTIRGYSLTVPFRIDNDILDPEG